MGAKHGLREFIDVDVPGRVLRCRVCGRTLAVQPRGRPPEVCGEARCRRVYERNRKLTECRRCGERLAASEDPLAALCITCRAEVALIAA